MLSAKTGEVLGKSRMSWLYHRSLKSLILFGAPLMTFSLISKPYELMSHQSLVYWFLLGLQMGHRS